MSNITQLEGLSAIAAILERLKPVDAVDEILIDRALHIATALRHTAARPEAQLPNLPKPPRRIN